jgi:hypothetical protein
MALTTLPCASALACDMAASEEDKSFSDDETGPTASTSDRIETTSLTYTKDTAKDKNSDRAAVPQDFFVYIGPVSKPGSSLPSK